MKLTSLSVAAAAAVVLGLTPLSADAARKHAVRTARAKPKAAAPAAPANPLPGIPFPVFADASQVASACGVGIDGAVLREKQLELRKPGLDWLKGWDDLYSWQEDHGGALVFLKNVHPNAEIRAAAEACELRWQEFQSALGLNEKIYLLGKKSVLKDPIDRRAVEVALEGFEDSGVALPVDRRPRARELSDRIISLGEAFDKNIRDERVRVAFTEAEMKGVPDSVWKDRPRDPDGKVSLGIDDPTFYAVLQGAEDAAARERLWRAKANQGGNENLKVLQQITRLRLEYAKLFGCASYDDFLLRHRMIGNTARATKFLDDVQAAVAEKEKRDLADLRDAKARHLGVAPEGVKLQRWDTLFYAERLKRERFAVDDEGLRPYFPPQESLRFVMRVAERLFGVRYDRVDGKYWSPDVQAYAVTDVATGRKIASLYVDPYAREGKYNHTSVWGYRNAAAASDRAAQAVLVANLDRRGLTLPELQTLLHEFGHTLHNNLSAARYASDGGMNVMQDFLEAPSQMLEDWVFDKKVLKVFQEVCPSCKPVPEALVDKARAAQDFGKGLLVARQQLFASYDLALHGPTAPDPMDTWTRMEAATPLGYVPGTAFPSGFAHIAGAYGAGYYGYLWSQAVALDLRTAFGGDRLDPKLGARYRAAVIGQGGQKPP
ncbi:MAG: M3 family metallopeptidase, partial [Burkholderiaceae bacterium]